MTNKLMRQNFGLCLALFMAMIICLNLTSAKAQGLALGGNDQPIEIFADNGIEWQQDSLVFLARGNAKAINGDVTVFADELRAYYREVEGGTDIYRLDALGNVRIVGAGETAYGGKAVYDVDNAVLVLSEGNLRLETKTDVVTARQQLEYWEKKNIAVARGDATATREDRTLQADVLTAHFAKNQNGENRVHRVDAFDNVKVKTKTEEAQSRRGIYNVDSGVATLTGDVTITKGNNVIRGCAARINMKTGVSTMQACAGENGKRARGTFVPNRSGTNN